MLMNESWLRVTCFKYGKQCLNESEEYFFSCICLYSTLCTKCIGGICGTINFSTSMTGCCSRGTLRRNFTAICIRHFVLCRLHVRQNSSIQGLLIQSTFCIQSIHIVHNASRNTSRSLQMVGNWTNARNSSAACKLGEQIAINGQVLSVGTGGGLVSVSASDRLSIDYVLNPMWVKIYNRIA